MKYFNHDTDAHRGKTMQQLMDEFRHEGPYCYWIIHEMCAEKLEKTIDFKEVEVIGPDGKTTKILEPYFTCKFSFHSRSLLQDLRVGQAKAMRILSACAAFDLFSFEVDGKLIRFSFPNLLKSLPSKTKTRLLEAATRNQKVPIDKNREEEIREEKNIKLFDSAFEKFITHFPGAPKGSGALRSYNAHVGEERHNEFLKSIEHYASHLENNKWRPAKQSFRSYIGELGQDAFWLEFKEPRLNVRPKILAPTQKISLNIAKTEAALAAEEQRHVTGISGALNDILKEMDATSVVEAIEKRRMLNE